MLYFCVDFDGTICKHIFPRIGDEVPNAIKYLKRYQELGVKLILFTMRSDESLAEAVAWCKEKGLEFYGINRNPAQYSWTKSPKAYGNLYIDDAAVGCPIIIEEGGREYVDWDKMNAILMERIDLDALSVHKPKKK